MPKKLIRNLVISKLKEGEWEEISNQTELNKLYQLKIQEELEEIVKADHKDITEFADLVQVAICYAKENGFNYVELFEAINKKAFTNGKFGRLALNNLNPNNPSNKLYFNHAD